MKPTRYRKQVLILIGLFAVLRAFTASVLELGNDEAYYWVYSQRLQWNYFDHPPMIAVWIRLFTLNGWLEDHEIIVRAGSIVSCACATWFLYRATSLVRDERTGWLAACLFNASLYVGMMAGVLAMPDSPQLFFWTLCLWQLARLVHNDRNRWAWLLFGLSAGFCIMSKVHGVFLWTGLGLFIVWQRREWLRKPVLYLSFLLSLLIISPIWLWNLKYDFVTWQFHSARVDILQPATYKDSFWIEWLDQVLVNNPFNCLLIFSGLWFFARRRRRSPALALYNWIALPFIAVLIVISLFQDIWFHWSGPAFTSLLPLAAVRLSQLDRKSLFPARLKWSTTFFTIALLAWPLIIYYYPGTYGSRHIQTLGKGDVTLDRYGWREAGEQFAKIYRQQTGNDSLPGQTPIVCPSWWGAHVEYYFARPVEATVIGLGSVEMLHHYAWLNQDRVRTADMDTAYCIVASIEDTATFSFYNNYYKKNELVTTIPVYRNGDTASNFYVRRFTGWKGQAEELTYLVEENKQ